MVSQFIFFMGIAAICFSGLMFTLWTLGTISTTLPNLSGLHSYDPCSQPTTGWKTHERSSPLLGF
jgi:hypothetical protein